MKLPKLCRSNSAVAVAVAVPVEQADASQARFEALMRSNFHNPDPLHNVKPDSQGYKWPVFFFFDYRLK